MRETPYIFDGDRRVYLTRKENTIVAAGMSGEYTLATKQGDRWFAGSDPFSGFPPSDGDMPAILAAWDWVEPTAPVAITPPPVRLTDSYPPPPPVAQPHGEEWGYARIGSQMGGLWGEY